jgi:hypothetical protein
MALTCKDLPRTLVSLDSASEIAVHTGPSTSL